MQKQLKKGQPGQRVAVLSPSFAAPGVFPEVFELGLARMREEFGLIPVEFPTTRSVGATTEERARDLIAAFEDKEIQAVFASLGGNDQVTYIKTLPSAPFVQNPKPFFGFSDNTHFMNFLWLQGIPSFYGGAVMTQFAMQGSMDVFTVDYLRKALFTGGEVALTASETFNEIGLDWKEPMFLSQKRLYEENVGWFWDGKASVSGITWGGCLESIDEILRHAITIPSLEAFSNIVLCTETSEEIPSHEYVRRVFRALGERGILARVKAVLVGRPKSWEFDKPYNKKTRDQYKKDQRETIINIVRTYNASVPIVQNMDFGHTDPQIPLPLGMPIRLDSEQQTIHVTF